MTHTEYLERFSKSLALFSPGDPEAADELRTSLAEWQDAVGEHAPPAIEETCKRIQELLEGLESKDDAGATVEELSALLTALQDQASELESEGTDSDDGDPIDHELLGLFVASCETTLSDLEGEVLGAEKADDPAESIAGVRRTIHTFKGECGVLSLSVAQELCHRMETAIDQALEGNLHIPTDLILELVDWLRSYVDRLKHDNRAEPPQSQKLSDGIDAYLNGETPEQQSACRQASEESPSTDSEATAAEEEEGDDELVSFEIEEDYLENLPEFLSEAQSHLVDAEAAILEFDKEGRSDFELIDRTFRSFHTIKGVAGFLNLTPVVDLAHTAETLMDGLRKKSFVCTTHMVDLILQSCDALGRLVDVLQGEAFMSQKELSTLIKDLKAATDNPDSTDGVNDGSPSSKTQEILGEPEESSAAPSPESGPTAQEEAPAREPEAKTEPAAPKPETPKASAPEPAAAQQPARTAPPMDAKKQTAKRQALAKKLDSTITVSTTRLDNLVDLVGELVIAQSMIAQDPQLLEVTSQKLSRNLSQVNKITRDLQEGAMSLRMVTLKSTFQKMARLVRDVSAKAKKQVDFQISGEDTELDRNVVEEISDPLVHMIRNAIDHGIETPDDRGLVGKPSTGTLQLKAYHQGGSIVIEISDDGRGIAKQKILNKAIERGLVPEETTPDDLSDQEIYGLLFQAGFSTAEKVTDISGRGVGMDVVKRNIEALRGKVEIDSEVGKGTTFKMMLPLTLAIIDGMVIRVGAQRYVIPTLAIVQSFQPEKELLTRVFDEGETVRVRGELLPVRRLRDIFALAEGEQDPTKGLLIVLEDNTNRSCLLVDEIIGQQQVVIKNLGKATGNIPGVSGGAILGDGRIALILDIGSLLEPSAAKLS